MKPNKIIILFVLFVLNTTFLQAEFRRYYYSGKMDNKYQIGFDIKIDNNNIDGKYFYYSQSEFLRIEGKIDNNGKIAITESTVEGKPTGSFTGTISNDYNSIEGFWISENKKKKLPFKLLKEAEYRQIKHDKYDASVEYPSFNLNNRKDFISIDEVIAKQAKRYYDSNVVYVESNIKELGGDEAEDIEKYSCTSNCSIRYSDEVMKSIVETHDSYTGGAHPNYYYTCHNYNKDGNDIALNSVVEMNEKALKQIDKIIVDMLRKKEADWIIDESHPSFVKEISKNEIPYIFTSTGIYFFFAPYAAGSYAQGDFVVIVPHDKIKNIIKPDSPIQHLIK